MEGGLRLQDLKRTPMHRLCCQCLSTRSFTSGSNIVKHASTQKGLDSLEVCYCLWGCHPDPRLGPIPGPSRSHPGFEGGPILVPSVPSSIGPGRAESDFLATSGLQQATHAICVNHIQWETDWRRASWSFADFNFLALIGSVISRAHDDFNRTSQLVCYILNILISNSLSAPSDLFVGHTTNGD